MTRGSFAASVRWAAVAAIAALAAFPADAQSLRIGLAADPDTLDPTISRTVASRVVFTALCDKLIDIDAALNYVPQLATEWSWSADTKSLTLKLRSGVRFHDGEPFNAAAVKYTLDRAMTLPGTTRKSELGPLESVDVVDELTARINLARPFSPLLSQLADRSGMMISPKAAAALGDKFGNAPVCAGPFKLKERVAQDRIVLDKFAGHWRAADVHFDRITYLPIPDSSIRLANLRAGGLDLAETLAPSDVAILKDLSDLRMATGASLASVYIAINTNHTDRAKTPLGQNATLRAALDLAIDREILNQVAFDGKFIPGNQPVPPSSPWYVKSVPIPKRDLARARALVKEAGLERLKVKLTVPNASNYPPAAQVLQAMAAEAGIDLELVVTEVNTALAQWTAGDFEALIILWSGRVDPDGDSYTFKACDGALNGGKYCNAEVDRLLNDARSHNDFATRYADYETMSHIVFEQDRPYIYLWHPALIYGMSNRLEGFQLVPDGMIRIPGMRFKS